MSGPHGGSADDTEGAARIAQLTKTWQSGWTCGQIELLMWALENPGSLERSFKRRFPKEYKRWKAGDDVVLEVPVAVDSGGPEDGTAARPNSPEDVGAKGKPGGWTGGQSIPATAQPAEGKPKRSRRSKRIEGQGDIFASLDKVGGSFADRIRANMERRDRGEEETEEDHEEDDDGDDARPEAGHPVRDDDHSEEEPAPPNLEDPQW